jgi:hypothetical protein
MRDPYQVLGVLPGAPDQEVKSAFRALAKQLHPDLHPNDAGADQAFRDVATAYQTLSDPRLRVAYDTAVASRHRSLNRRRLRARAATTIAVFALTVCSVSAAVLWRDYLGGLLPPTRNDPGWAPRNASAPDSVEALAPLSQDVTSQAPVVSVGPLASTIAEVPREPPLAIVAAQDRSSAGEPGTPPLLEHKPTEHRPLVSVGLANSGHALVAGKGPLPAAPRQSGTWASYRSAALGFALQYPADVFVSAPSPSDEGESFRSHDGRARLVIFAAPTTNGTTLPKHRQSLVEGPYKGAAFDYTPQRSTWFVLSGTLGDTMFYERVTFACDGRTFHGWKLVYPLAERTLYDRIVEELHRRYRHGNGPGGRCNGNASRHFRPDGKAATPQ